MDDFQYIDVYQFDLAVPSKAECFGPNYHLKMLCKICDSCYGDIYCSNCVKSGSFGTVTKSNVELTFSDESNRLNENKIKLDSLSLEIGKHVNPSFKKDFAMQLKSLQHIIKYLKKDIIEKQRKVSNIRSQIKRCRAEHSKILPKQIALKNLMSNLHERKIQQGSLLTTLNSQLNGLRSERVQELIDCYFPINVSDIIDRVDTIAGTPLNIDKIHIYSVPEPTTSSHVALVHMAIATRTVAYLFNVWLPTETRRQLRLGNVIATAGDFPRRDHIARVYLAVSRAVQLVCTACGLSTSSTSISPIINDASMLDANSSPSPPEIVDLTKPLAGLFLLVQSRKNIAKSVKTRMFDESYTLLRNDIFGSLQTTLEDSRRRSQSSAYALSFTSAAARRSMKINVCEIPVPHEDNCFESDSDLSMSSEWEVVSFNGIEEEGEEK